MVKKTEQGKGLTWSLVVVGALNFLALITTTLVLGLGGYIGKDQAVRALTVLRNPPGDYLIITKEQKELFETLAQTNFEKNDADGAYSATAVNSKAMSSELVESRIKEVNLHNQRLSNVIEDLKKRQAEIEDLKKEINNTRATAQNRIDTLQKTLDAEGYSKRMKIWRNMEPALVAEDLKQVLGVLNKIDKEASVRDAAQIIRKMSDTQAAEVLSVMEGMDRQKILTMLKSLGSATKKMVEK